MFCVKRNYRDEGLLAISVVLHTLDVLPGVAQFLVRECYRDDHVGVQCARVLHPADGTVELFQALFEHIERFLDFIRVVLLEADCLSRIYP